MIQTFKHKGLKRLYEHGDRRGLPSERIERIENTLGRLDIAKAPVDLDLPGYRLHALKGDWKNYWSVKVSGNWRIIFRIEDGDVFDVNLIDYH